MIGFWLFLLLAFLETINYDYPNWVRQDSLIKMNPGLSFRPRPPIDKIDSLLITYKVNNLSTYKHMIDEMNLFLERKNFF